MTQQTLTSSRNIEAEAAPSFQDMSTTAGNDIRSTAGIGIREISFRSAALLQSSGSCAGSPDATLHRANEGGLKEISFRKAALLQSSGSCTGN